MFSALGAASTAPMMGAAPGMGYGAAPGMGYGAAPGMMRPGYGAPYGAPGAFGAAPGIAPPGYGQPPLPGQPGYGAPPGQPGQPPMPQPNANGPHPAQCPMHKYHFTSGFDTFQLFLNDTHLGVAFVALAALGGYCVGRNLVRGRKESEDSDEE